MTGALLICRASQWVMTLWKKQGYNTFYFLFVPNSTDSYYIKLHDKPPALSSQIPECIARKRYKDKSILRTFKSFLHHQGTAQWVRMESNKSLTIIYVGLVWSSLSLLVLHSLQLWLLWKYGTFLHRLKCGYGFPGFASAVVLEWFISTSGEFYI